MIVVVVVVSCIPEEKNISSSLVYGLDWCLGNLNVTDRQHCRNIGR